MKYSLKSIIRKHTVAENLPADGCRDGNVKSQSQLRDFSTGIPQETGLRAQQSQESHMYTTKKLKDKTFAH